MLRVLLIENNEDDAALILRELKCGGYEPVARRVETPDAMHRALRQETWDAVLTNWNLPEFSALFALEMLKSQGLDLPFIIVSGTIGEEAAISAMKAGGHDFVSKEHLGRLVLTIEREMREAADRRARRRGEVALAASEERLQLVGRATNDAVRDWDLSTNGLWWNEGFSVLFGHQAQDVEAGVESWYSLLYPGDKDRVIASCYAAINGGSTTWSESYRFRRADGTYAEVLDRGYIVRNVRGQALRLIGALTDLTAIRKAHAALKESEARVRTVLESSIDAIICMDENGMIIDWNPRAEAMFGRSRDEALGHAVAETIIPPAQREAHRSGLRRFTETGEGPMFNRRVETTACRRDGAEFPVEVSIVSLKEGATYRFYWFVVDISERRVAEMKLRQTEEQLRQAQKMEAIGQLAGGVAHDFNNLLTVITGYTDLLMSDPPTDASRLENLEEIRNAAERASWLTRQLLAFSRRQILTPQVLDLKVLIDNLEKMLCRLIGEDVVLKTELVPAPARIKADPGQIEQIIMNLAVNARDAMPKGGRLTIEAHTVLLDESYPIKPVDLPAGLYVLLAVSDTGCGMDAETQKRIFEPFFTTKETGKGTGLGLSTVYGIVKQSSGFICVYSELGLGTTFKIYLPAVDEDVQTAKTESRLVQQRIGVETILLVEDAAPLLALTKKILELNGYTVLAAGNLAEALKTAEARNWAIHLLLTDVIMPGGNGPDIADRLEERCPDLKILYMSGYTGRGMAHQKILESGRPLIQKPYSPDALLQKVGEVLDEPWEGKA
ncbi:MAG: PAS domain S-box protein [Nitrospiraceae bacterium]|nr:PAS domain S-box protein [Nitrospiraceae bacterium]